MPEQINLTTPLSMDPRMASTLLPEKLVLDWKAQGVHLTLGNANGVQVTVSENGAAATTLMNQLNTANLPVKSLLKRAMEWAQTKLPATAGTITGTPD